MIKGKSFLITQPMIHGLNGSTTATLELAEYLYSQDATVTVYTYYYDNPAKKFFEEKNIRVVCAQEDPKFLLSDFDFIWIHSQVLPISIIKAFGDRLPKKLPRFIFHHMSPLDWIPDERPYIFDLENKLSSMTLFISTATQKEQSDYFNNELKFGLFRNPAPKVFSELNYSPRKKLKNILIVSNHPPRELVEASDLLKQNGFNVVSFGETSEEYSLITPELLKKFDVVITIGKTVQYCLVSGVPVYIYDHFGGSGYLGDSNYAAAADRNFSGRDGQHQTSDYLANDIVKHYHQAVNYQADNRKRFIDELSIDKVFPAILNEVETRAIDQFDLRYMNAVISAQIFGKIRFETGAHDWNSAKMNERLQEEKEQLRKETEDLRAEIKAEQDLIWDIRQSDSFRVGSAILKPFRFIKQVTRRHLND